MIKLQSALEQVSKRVQNEANYTGMTTELYDRNIIAIGLFESIDAVYTQRYQGDAPLDIKIFTIYNVHEYLKINGIDFPTINYNELVDWLYKNWIKVLQTIQPLLALM